MRLAAGRPALPTSVEAYEEFAAEGCPSSHSWAGGQSWPEFRPRSLSSLVSRDRRARSAQSTGIPVPRQRSARREWASGGRVSPAAGTGTSPNIRDSHTWTASRTPPVRKRMLASLLTPWRDPTDEQKRCSSRFRPIPGNSLLGGKKASRQQAPSAFSAAVLRELCDCLFLVPSTSLFRML